MFFKMAVWGAIVVAILGYIIAEVPASVAFKLTVACILLVISCAMMVVIYKKEEKWRNDAEIKAGKKRNADAFRQSQLDKRR